MRKQADKIFFGNAILTPELHSFTPLNLHGLTFFVYSVLSEICNGFEKCLRFTSMPKLVIRTDAIQANDNYDKTHTHAPPLLVIELLWQETARFVGEMDFSFGRAKLL